ncbi:sugar-phosphatase [Proteus myxofaciens]|uniref:Haloacid dehalogenase-like sugar phosphatase n=1 Tax=Proteus myxofaciens ATCC 19692 TaxID=1354337 RepID=A0A198GM70_9GAMM|nr:sugar-phosphatase [Proteus myxofaciens]OAT37281.1 haloacid dehalogenase-like sugar phosphatase [Proteus myxofaciens ATCC 19692]
MSIKLVAIDLDGTLLNNQHKITQEVKDAIQRTKESGTQILLASGRSFNGISPYLKELGLDTSDNFCISNNGSQIHQADSGEVIIEDLLNFEDYLYFENLSREIGVHFHALSDNKIYTTNRHISHFTCREAFLTWTPLYYRPLNEMQNDMRFSKFMIVDTPTVLDNAMQYLPANIYEQYSILRSAPYFIEILNTDVNKGNAVKKIAEHLKITPEKIMCIGDQDNDLAMLKYAGLSVAMENAPEAIKKIAKFVTLSNEEHGVAAALNKFI